MKKTKTRLHDKPPATAYVYWCQYCGRPVMADSTPDLLANCSYERPECPKGGRKEKLRVAVYKLVEEQMSTSKDVRNQPGLVLRKIVKPINRTYNHGRKVGLWGYLLECGHKVSSQGTSKERIRCPRCSDPQAYEHPTK